MNLFIKLQNHYVVECTKSSSKYFFQLGNPYVIVNRNNEFFICDDLKEENLIDFDPFHKKIELKLSDEHFYEFKLSKIYELDTFTGKLLCLE